LTFDLRIEAWIPYLRANGLLEWGSPARLTDGISTGDPIVALATSRPDFDGALHEFLIGLLALALAPADEDEWLARWHTPPTPDELRVAFESLPPAFACDGDGPRVFQDLAASEFGAGDVSAIAQLLIDAPGEQGIRQNKDLFVKRERVDVLSRASAAMALITMQTYAPAGGAGNRTSMRGGGPLTTLVDPRRPDGSGETPSLWHLLWANVETVAQREERAGGRRSTGDADITPWLAPTRRSDGKKGGGATTPRDADPLQAYFGLPRRLRLVLGGPGRCDLTGRDDERTVTGFAQRPYGVQYLGWHHPLTPHYETKDGWLPLHGQADGIVWRDWLGLLVKDAVPARRPAQCVSHFLRERADATGCTAFTVRAFGYDMDNMKARGWIESRVPAFAIPDQEARERLTALVGRLVEATGLVAYVLQLGTKTALFGDADAAGDLLSSVKLALWQSTERAFYDAVRALLTGAPADALLASFRQTLEREALAIFDRTAGTEATAPDAMRRLVGARYTLVLALRGRSKAGAKLFTALALPLPSITATASPATAAAKPTKAKGRTRSAATRTKPSS
jgi:CRISPR system Cascade subunit CasA